MVLSRALGTAYVAAPEHEYGWINIGLTTFATVNEARTPEVSVPLVNVTVSTPLTMVADAAGLPVKPENEETVMLWPGTLVKLWSVTTKRLKLLTLVGVKDITALVDALPAIFCRPTTISRKEWVTKNKYPPAKSPELAAVSRMVEPE